MKKYLTSAIVALFAVFSILLLADTGNAQMRRGRGNNYTKVQVDRIIKNVEQRTDAFVSQFNSSLDNSRLNGSRREDVLNEKARRLESATDELRREFDRRDSYAENRPEVQKCLDIAADINVAMQNRRFGRVTENNWANVRAELNALARVYGLPQIGSGAYR